MLQTTIQKGSKVKVYANPSSCKHLEVNATVNEVHFTKSDLSYCSVTDEDGRVSDCFIKNNPS